MPEDQAGTQQGGTGGQGEGAGAGQQQGAGAGTGAAADAGKQQGAGGQQQGQQGEVKAFWPEDWRKKWAGEDSKKLARLERYASPEAAFDALVSVQNRISAGELRSNLPKDATAEQLVAWRKENGIPETADKYEIGLTKGRVIGDADKEWIGDLAKHAHGLNVSNSQMSGLIDWYYGFAQRQEEKTAEGDQKARQEGEDKLRVEWGPEFRRNVNLAKSLLGTVPESVRDEIMGARLANGTPLMSNPDALKWLVGLQLQINPMASVMPGAGGDIGKAIVSEIQDIEKQMGNKNSDYWKGPKAESLQARYRELVEARDRGARKAA